MKLGKATYGGEFTKRKYFKLKDGEQTFRILPPMGDLADAGVWSKFYAVCFGYLNTEGKMRTFVSPLVKNHKTKMIEVPCAATQRIEKLKAELAKAKEAGNDAAVKQLEELVGYNGRFNVDKNHYMNVIDVSTGQIGVLQLRHKAKVSLENSIKKLRATGVDPLSTTDGRAFVFTRTGMGNETAFAVEVQQETLNIEGVGQVKRDKSYILGDDIVSRLKSEAAELNKLFPMPSSEEVAAIVKEGAPAVDRILNRPAKATAVETADEDNVADYEEAEEPAAPAAAATPAATAQKTTPAAATATTKTEPAKAAPTPAAQPTAAQKAESKPQPAAQTSEDFLKSLGL